MYIFITTLINGRIEDPFSYANAAFNRGCYDSGESSKVSGGSIDMRLLTVVFGGHLKDLVKAVSNDVEAKAETDHAIQKAVTQDVPDNSRTEESKLSGPCKVGDMQSTPYTLGKTHTALQLLVRRWRIVIFTLPAICVLLSCRFAVWYGGGVGGWIDPTVFTSFISVVIFVSVILMQGVIQDYKEAEKMPSVLFSALQALTATMQVT